MIDASNRSADLLAEALQLAISLDSFTTFDWAETIGPAVLNGSEKLRELERRQESLTVSGTDEATLGWVLEAIHGRLIFLDRLYTEVSPPHPAKIRPGTVREPGEVNGECGHLTTPT
ncbi:MAG TPA: hypothetical protein VKT75_07930 [Acidobacteriaceae bacterium]|nr:hypothetical protein [Acidobacteriaceae bacterium]